jgi:hypothetical protein
MHGLIGFGGFTPRTTPISLHPEQIEDEISIASLRHRLLATYGSPNMKRSFPLDGGKSGK